MQNRREFFGLGLATAATVVVAPASASEAGTATTFIDPTGTWRWRSDQSEVALFGVNYCAISASGFRALKAVGSDIRVCIDRDLAHLKRLGCDAIRLCFWGDWENSTPEGHLLVNEHLDLLDYLVAEASKAGFYMLLSPIVTYDAFWPDAMNSKKSGFSNKFSKESLGQAREPILAQVTYLTEFLSRVNPLTGNTYAKEPHIVAVEPINEPWHHSETPEIERLYLTALCKTVRATGYEGPIFFNLTQDMGMAPFIGEQPLLAGPTLGWYPTGLTGGQAAPGNHLPLADDFPVYDHPALKSKARMVYEFDAADSMATYMLPAMVRNFRSGGVQWATMFTYDAVDSAGQNLEFNDHFLNLVFTPGKAVSLAIAAKVLKNRPRFAPIGTYPQNKIDEGLFLDPLSNCSVYENGKGDYLHTGSTDHVPANIGAITRIAGCGNSQLVRYDGTGAYFLEQIEPGAWRVEVYPDNLIVDNPFGKQAPTRMVSRIWWNTRAMSVALPDLGVDFDICSEDGTQVLAKANARQLNLTPGRYLLRKAGMTSFPKLPALPPFYAPAASVPAVEWGRITWPLAVYAGSTPATVEVIGTTGAHLVVTSGGGFAHTFSLTRGPGFTMAISESMKLPAGEIGYRLVADSGAVLDQGTLNVLADPAVFPLVAFPRDASRFLLPYGGYYGSPAMLLGEHALSVDGRGVAGTAPKEIVCQFNFERPVRLMGAEIERYSAVRIRLRAASTKLVRFHVALIDFDGFAVGQIVEVPAGKAEAKLSLNADPARITILPRGLPLAIPKYYRQPDPANPFKARDLAAIQFAVGDAFSGDADKEPRFEIVGVDLVEG